MGLETGSYISDLVATNPAGSDDRSTADDHIRLIKSILKTQFPNLNAAVNANPTVLNLLVGLTANATELNQLDGATITAAVLNALNGLSVAQINALAGLSDSQLTALQALSVAEIGYLDGVTSDVQTQINNLGARVAVNAADGGPYVDSLPFSISTHIAAAWESVGPDGSGATNIWTALDSVPAGVAWIEVRISNNIIGTLGGAGVANATIYARKNGSSVINDGRSTISAVNGYANSTLKIALADVATLKIPVSSSRVFDLYVYDNSGAASFSSSMYLVGYGYN